MATNGLIHTISRLLFPAPVFEFQEASPTMAITHSNITSILSTCRRRQARRRPQGRISFILPSWVGMVPYQISTKLDLSSLKKKIQRIFFLAGNLRKSRGGV
eukprot:TRINITY_DN163200_c0_g1_i1.p3 TRINITY_DN163200_c0_g1~~TRINITY_DN163200_c0_g1_i1.p3  ORF type:complete len:102 (+),score=4.20 TRINITY_DN163200_c0_g1_i1:3-308(+)